MWQREFFACGVELVRALMETGRGSQFAEPGLHVRVRLPMNCKEDVYGHGS
jgi:hypothetical protein